MEYMPRPPPRNGNPFGFQNNRNIPNISEMSNLNRLYTEGKYEELFIEYRKLRDKYWSEYPNGSDPFPNNFTKERYETAKMQLYTAAIERIKQYTLAKDIIDFIDRHPALLSFSDIQQIYNNNIKVQQDFERNARQAPPRDEFDGLTPVQIFEKYRASRSVYEKNPKYVEIYNKSKLDMLNYGETYLAGKTPSQILEFFRQNPSYILINELLPIKQRAEAAQNAPPEPPPQRRPPGDADRARRQAEADARAGERFAKQQAEENARRRQAEEDARRARQAEEDARRRQAEEDARRRQDEEDARRARQEQPKKDIPNCPSNNIEPIKHSKKSDYLKQTLLLHPDKNQGCPKESEAKFKKLAMLNPEYSGYAGKFEPDDKWQKAGKKKSKKSKKSKKNLKLKSKKYKNKRYLKKTRKH